MKERPIIFNTNMVKAILEGRKTQTRRPIKPQPLGHSLESILDGKWFTKSFDGLLSPKIKDLPMHCPFGQIGDRLWVRETFRLYDSDECPHADFPCGCPRNGTPLFKASHDCGDGEKWTPSIHMPRSTCRLVLEIINIRVERLYSLTNEDAVSEGIEQVRVHTDGTPVFKNYGFKERDSGTKSGFGYPVNSFQSLWESVYGADSWTANPWVWVVEFKVIQGGES